MRAVASAILALGLIACSSAPSSKSGADAPPAAPAAPLAAKLHPGQWRSTMTFIDVSAPGMPKGAGLHMKPIVVEDCVTSDDIDAYLNKKATHDDDGGAACGANSLHAAGGLIQGTSTCKSPDGSERQIAMTGTYTPEQVDMTMKIAGQSPRGPMSSTMHIVSQRIGDCAK